MRRSVTAALACAGLSTVVVGCAASSSSGLSATAAHNLRVSVENIRQVAATGSYSQLQQAVNQLRSLVQQEEQSGDVSSERANQILDAAGILLTDAKPKSSPSPSPTIPPTTTTVPSPTPTPTPTSSPSPTPSATPTSSQSPLVKVSAQPL